ncbi:SRPBCC family protein [Nannocystaceae bacterium ST9]
MNPNRTVMDLVSEREIVITRSFRAPTHVVFDAWTKPEHLRRWWAPLSRGVSVIECDADLRVGGRYRYVIGRGEDQFAFSGEYLEFARPTRLVYTQSFEPLPGAAVITVSFEAQPDSTKLTAHEVYPTAEARAQAIASGMEEGMRETMDLLDALLGA